MVQNVKYTNNSEEKWSNTGILVADNEWEHIYMTPFKVTIQSKLQSFQYQILKRSLVTNKFLYLCKIKDSNNCHFCKAHIETIEHLFFDCKAVHTFWMNVIKWLPVELEFRGFVSRKNVLLGDTQCKNNVILNHLSIIGKRYIYVSRCLDRKLNVQGFARTVVQCYRMEKDIAGRNEKTNLFENKWKLLKHIIDPLI